MICQMRIKTPMATTLRPDNFEPSLLSLIEPYFVLEHSLPVMKFTTVFGSLLVLALGAYAQDGADATPTPAPSSADGTVSSALSDASSVSSEVASDVSSAASAATSGAASLTSAAGSAASSILHGTPSSSSAAQTATSGNATDHNGASAFYVNREGLAVGVGAGLLAAIVL
ncbi:hypothetical protein D9758_012583 [Tetrapyrgos nigripes]|uniref:Uncharacterized protein n=1 Tax=Tetrapyrgos nigripes TaxID=182062 RepID=A0A8H5CIP3_9AGAR|nr:hypothetical protein D9758_012583 [Tetrapyrgos nigripes]